MRHSRTILSLFAGAAVFGALLLAGCPPEDNENPCQDVTCDFGTCNPNNGKCQNRSTCNTRTDCLPGYKCRQGSCESIERFECQEDSDCKTRKCRNGVCANPDSCQQNTDCLPRTYCDKTANPSGDAGADASGSADTGTSSVGVCNPDPCNEKTCRRGICKRGTDRCISKQNCTEDSELLDCVPGEKCYIKEVDAEGECLNEQNFCDQLDCGDNGVCSFEGGGCVNAETCQGAGDCRDGYFCNSMNKCRRDLCERNNIDCGDDGVCQPGSGQCQNETSCQDTSDCISNPRHLCVDGTCVLETQACGSAMGDGGCRGRQTCEYDSDNNTATCQEPETCKSSLDCKSGRRCGGRKCLSAEMCTADRLEDNDSASAATPFTDAARRGTLRASFCQGDPDVYSLNTTGLAGIDGATSGKLVVELNVRDRERGLGRLNMELTKTADDGSTTTVDTANTGAKGRDGRARINTGFGVADHMADWTIEVTGQNMEQTGVQYSLSADIVKQNALNACRNATEVSPNQRVSGTTNKSTSSDLGSSCTSRKNPSNEKVYRLNIDRPQELTFKLTANVSDADLTMSLRRRCTQRSTEIACTNDNGEGADERMTKIVGPGTYSLIVQSPKGSSGGRFNLSIDRVFTVCAQSDNYCGTGGNANVCTVNGGRFNTVNCVNDCNPSTGRCIPPDGNQCGSAKTISPMNASTRTLQLNQARDTYNVSGGTNSCLGTSPTQTQGKDLSYKVEVPAESNDAKNASVRLEANFAGEVEGSMYLVEDCSDVDGSCKTGVKSSTDSDSKEVLKYTNTTGSDETLNLIVDTKGGQQVSTAELKVKYREVICTPDAEQCTSSNEVEKCNPYGVKYNTLYNCGAGCNNGNCQSDTCSNAVNITSQANQSGGVTYSQVDWAGFSNWYGNSPCSNAGIGSNLDTAGKDHFYQVDLQKKERLKFDADGKGDVSTWTWKNNDCSQSTSNATCLASQEEEGSAVSTTYVADKQRTVYVAVDRESDSGGQFEVSAEIDTAQCIPKTYGGMCKSGDRQVCKSDGTFATRTCADGCTSGTCDGENCKNSVQIKASDISSASNSTKSYTLDPRAYADDHNLNNFNCGRSFDDSPGGDFVLKVTDVQPSNTLDVTWDHDDGDLYIVDSTCGSAQSSCIGHDDVGFRGDANVTASPQSNPQDYTIFADVDPNSFTTRGDATLDVEIK